MNYIKIIGISILILFALTTFILAQEASPTREPSPIIRNPTPTPSSTTSPSSTSTSKPINQQCSGSAEMNIEGKDSIEGTKIDSSDKSTIEKIKNIILKLHESLRSNPNLAGFYACTYPSEFLCDKSKCNVDFTETSSVSLNPGSSEPSPEKVGTSGSGDITIYIGWTTIAQIGAPPIPDPTKPGAEKDWLSNLLDLLLPDIIVEISKITEEIRKKHPCPEGYTQSITVTPDLNNVKVEDWGWFSALGKKVIVPYTYIAKCQRTEGEKIKTYIDVQLKFKKECTQKDG